MKVIKLFAMALAIALATPATAQVKVLGKSGSTSTQTSNNRKASTTRNVSTKKSSSAGSQYSSEGFQGGAEFAYGTDMKAFGLGARLMYGFTENIRLDVSDHYYFKKEFSTLDDLNANLHYIVNIGDNLDVYPLAGVSLMLWKVDVNVEGEKFSASDTSFGINIGGGIQYGISSDAAINAELKYQSYSGGGQLTISAGVIYHF